MQSEFHAMNK